MRFRISRLLGQLANLAGLPCWVSPGEYRASVMTAVVTVRRSSLYTVVTVNGLDVYFHRLTGKIDGVGASLAPGCTPVSAPGSTRSGEQSASSPGEARR